jgi:hypothetical protein
MNFPAPLSYLKCASPGCRAEARDGHVCSFHNGTLYVDRSLAAVGYRIVATDPAKPFVVRAFLIRALSLRQAEEAAHDQLIQEGRGHWPMKSEMA